MKTALAARELFGALSSNWDTGAPLPDVSSADFQNLAAECSESCGCNGCEG